MAGSLVQGALFTVMVVRAGHLRDPAFAHELAEQVERSPRFFQNAPVVLDLKGADGFTPRPSSPTRGRLLREHTLALVGVQNALPAQLEAAAAAGFASFAPSATQPGRARAPEAAPAPRAVRPGSAASVRTRLVTEPVRSGTQIYARGTDLVVTAVGQPGRRAGGRRQHPCLRRAARPRAGRRQRRYEARIFCSRLEAELVSIAGRYLVSEQLPRGSAGLAGADRARR